MLSSIVKNKIQSLWDRLWSGGLSNPITAIEQISFLLFMKRLDKFDPKIEDIYKWEYYHEMTGESLVNHVKDKVFDYIKNGLDDNKLFNLSMKDAYFRINNFTLLEDAIKYIDEIYKEIEKEEEGNQHFQDIQGDLYEYLLKHTNEAGKNGQFRTPRHIIQMMAEILDPDIDGKICDVASGSAGFLVGAYQYIIKKYSKHIEEDENGLSKGLDASLLDENQKNILRQNTLYGFDIDQTMVRIGMMNLMMHGITKPNIINLDTLSNEYEEFQLFNSEQTEVQKSDIGKGVYKYILANPPFTGKINSLTISNNLDRIYSSKYKDDKQIKQTVQSELLFLERIVSMLEVGGRAAVIVPEGVLFNAGKAHQKVREILMTDCNLMGVISLPEGVFQPYTSVKTSILIFEKRTSYNNDMKVWFYDLKSDGYSLDANRKRLKDSPLPVVIQEWRERNEKEQDNRKLQHFSVSYEEISENGYELNINSYKDFIYEPKNLRSPNLILEELSKLEDEIFKGLEELKK